MTTYYVSPYGSDSNAGTGPAPAQAWLTIGKALGAAGISSGDVLNVCPGTYREIVTIGMTSAVVETIIRGDVTNSSGFTNGSGDRVPGGDVIWTAYTTSDSVAPASSTLIDVNTRDFLTFENFTLIGGNADPSLLTAAVTSVNLVFRNCYLASGRAGTYSLVSATIGFGIAANWVFERCVILYTCNSSTRFALSFALTRGSTGSDYDVNIQIRNCLFIGGHTPININSAGGSGTIYGGGVDVDHCTFLAVTGNCFRSASSNLSTSIPCTIQNSLAIGATGFFATATAAGVVVDNGYNVSLGMALSGVTQAGSSVVDGSVFPLAPLLEFGQAWLNKRNPRPILTPLAASPFVGFTAGVAQSVDWLNRPRPSIETTATVGALERHDTIARETTTTRTGATAARFEGPGDQEYLIPVAATATTISIYARYDSNYTGSLPLIELLNGAECGVADASDVMTAGADTWEQLSLSFTPARAGNVTLRLRSRSTAASAFVFFDDYAFSG